MHHTTTPAAAIRAQRAASNRAIAARDVDGVVACMLVDVSVAVAGGPRLTGREASRRAFIEQFAERAFLGYVREPDDVSVHDPPTTATERGRWEGRWRGGALEQVRSGRYVARWRHTSMGWLIASEEFREQE
ncbi:MAG: nuclear transport factor 2 family protein [Gemmatimonadetes bacterium]|nr:nuclear transport factor 2 family protein [Gemmatimonadota bacterium]